MLPGIDLNRKGDRPRHNPQYYLYPYQNPRIKVPVKAVDSFSTPGIICEIMFYQCI